MTAEERGFRQLAALLVLTLGADEVAENWRPALHGWQSYLAAAQRSLPPRSAAVYEALGEIVGDTRGQSRRLPAWSGDAGDAPRGILLQGGGLTLTACAAVAGCSTRTVRRRVVEGRLPATRVGRRLVFDPGELLRYLSDRQAA